MRLQFTHHFHVVVILKVLGGLVCTKTGGPSASGGLNVWLLNKHLPLLLLMLGYQVVNYVMQIVVVFALSSAKLRDFTFFRRFRPILNVGEYRMHEVGDQLETRGKVSQETLGLGLAVESLHLLKDWSDDHASLGDLMPHHMLQLSEETVRVTEDKMLYSFPAVELLVNLLIPDALHLLHDVSRLTTTPKREHGQAQHLANCSQLPVNVRISLDGRALPG